VNSVGEKVGGNRPDVQGTVGGQGVRRVHFEFDRPMMDGGAGSRVAGHVQDILNNDPNSVVGLVPSGPPG
jgi:hypothetical protein